MNAERPDAAFTEIPVVDLGSGIDDDRLAADLTEICHRIGFFVVENHGVAADLIDDTFAMMAEFFALSDDAKGAIDKRRSRHFRGWEAVGTEFTNDRPDIREQIDVWTHHPAHEPAIEPGFLRLLGPNQWMPDDLLPDHEARSMAWIDALAGLADRLMGLLSRGLGLGEHHLRDMFGDQPMSLAKFISYPPTPPGGAGVNAHHDAGFLTVLAAGETPGLQVQNQLGEWVDVPPRKHSFVINLGEIFQSITGNYFVATPHRVITEEARLSAGYFHGPSLTTSLAPLPLADRFRAAVAASPWHTDAGFMAPKDELAAGVGDMTSSHRPDRYGDQLWNYFARSYPEIMAEHYGSA